MNYKVIRPLPLTRETFAPYGEVIETDGHSFERINAGHTQKFTDLFHLDVSQQQGATQVSLYRSKPVSLPFKIAAMERHPLGSQAFLPLHGRPFPVVVAASEGPPEIGDIIAFISNGQQGINLARGTWHHYQITLEAASEYIVIDRQGPGDNLEEWTLSESVSLEV
jgi:ureidoglycolate lyase